MPADAQAFLDKYQADLARLERKASLASWAAATTGREEDYAAAAETYLAVRKLHSDRDTYQQVQRLLRDADRLLPLAARALRLAELEFRRNQLPPEMLAQLVELSTEIEQSMSNFRAELDGQPRSNNDLLELLRTENDSAKRQQAWEALKQVGGVVGPKLVELATLRNRAAETLGFESFWHMRVHLQEHDPEQLLGIFDELDRLSQGPK